MAREIDDIAAALKSIDPSFEFPVTDNTYAGISMDVGTKPTEAEVEAELDKLDAAYKAAEYQRKRQPQYPSIEDQLDMQYWDQVNSTTTWKDAIAKGKSDNPKP